MGTFFGGPTVQITPWVYIPLIWKGKFLESYLNFQHNVMIIEEEIKYETDDYSLLSSFYTNNV